jgi:hypothetical protein
MSSSAWRTSAEIVPRPGGLLERARAERARLEAGGPRLPVEQPRARPQEAGPVRCDDCGVDWHGRGVHGLHVVDERCRCGLPRQANCKNELLSCACKRGRR